MVVNHVPGFSYDGMGNVTLDNLANNYTYDAEGHGMESARNTPAVVALMQNLNASSTMRFARVFLLFLLGWSPQWFYAAQSKPPGCATPLWSVELIKGLDAARTPTRPFLMDENRAGITFLDNDRVIAYEVTVDTGKFSSREGPDISSPFRLHAYFLDVTSGRIGFSKEWGTSAHESFIQDASGGFLVRTGNLLRFYSKDLAEVQQMPLPHPDPYEGWEVRTSPSGKTILVNHYIREKKRRLDVSRFELLDGSTFQVKQSWTESPSLKEGDVYSISDTAMIKHQYDHGTYYTILSQFGSKLWKPVWKESEENCGSTFVTDGLFVFGCRQLSLVTTKGAVLMMDSFGKGESRNWKIATAQNGQALAISLNRSKGTDFWDTGKGIRLVATHLVVYDLFRKTRVLTVDVDPLPKNDYDFALSPDGSKLAVLNDHKVSVYSCQTSQASGPP